MAKLMDAEMANLVAEIVKVNPEAQAWENVNATIYLPKEAELLVLSSKTIA